MLLFYQNGFPQYQMVTFVLGSSWVVRHWEYVKGRTVRVVLVACYFGWLAAFDLYYAFVDEASNELYWSDVENWVGLPAFLVGCASSGDCPGRRRQSGLGILIRDVVQQLFNGPETARLTE